MNILLTLILLIVFLVLLFLLFFYLNRKKRSKIFLSPPSTLFLKEQKVNPDISTDNWALHKLRLGKFKRSQYKGLTFFLSSENRIYYLSEDGKKVYC